MTDEKPVKDQYHHGNLPQAVLNRVAAIIAADGPHGFTLRGLAHDLGVSHAAPRHHFGDREGVLRALAAQGFDRLTERLQVVRKSGGGFLELGVAYVEFASQNPAHFQVMFTPSLLGENGPELDRARSRAFSELTGGVDTVVTSADREEMAAAVIAGWSLVHGLVTLSLSGNLALAGVRELVAQDTLPELTRRTASLLFTRPEGRTPRPPDPSA